MIKIMDTNTVTSTAMVMDTNTVKIMDVNTVTTSETVMDTNDVTALNKMKSQLRIY